MISRRELFKRIGLTAAGLAVVPLVRKALTSPAETRRSNGITSQRFDRPARPLNVAWQNNVVNSQIFRIK